MGFYDDFYPGYYFSAGISAAWSFISLAVLALSIVAMWKLFVKAGEEGWAALVPFYNIYILFKISWGSGIMFLLLLIPIANFVIMIITWVKLSKAFGKGGGWACGLIFLNTIFICIMGFSNDIRYVGVPGKDDGNVGGGFASGGYQNPYQNSSNDSYQDSYRQYQNDRQQSSYQQQSNQNPDYHYQRSEAQQTGGTKYCPTCGASVEAGTKFCAKCGKQL